MPKIIGDSLTEHRAHIRERLFGALSRLLHERGFDSITMSDIATEAEFGRTAVYNHFEDKESLLLSFVNHETQQYVAQLHNALDGLTDPLEQLRVYVRKQALLSSVYHLAAGPDLRSVLSHEALGRMREHAELITEILRDIIDGGISAGALPDQDVELVIPLIHSCLNGRRFPDPGLELDRATAAAEEFILRAVGA